MNTIQCAHTPHHHKAVTCRLWTVSGGVHALLVCNRVLIYIKKYIDRYIKKKAEGKTSLQMLK